MQLLVLHKQCKNQRLKSLDSLLRKESQGLIGEIKIVESSTKISIFYWIVFIAEPRTKLASVAIWCGATVLFWCWMTSFILHFDPVRALPFLLPRLAPLLPSEEGKGAEASRSLTGLIFDF